MNPVLVKLFGIALALSQVTTQSNAVRTQFDPHHDQDAVVRLLQDGCAHVREVFNIESIHLDDLITTAMDDPEAMTAKVKALNGVSFEDLFSAYRQFCKDETVAQSPIDIGEIIAHFNKAAADLPDHTKLKELPGSSVMLDQTGGQLAELRQAVRRRVWIPLGEIPVYVQKAFVAAEDKRFYQHHGVDERGIIRAFAGNLGKSGRPQGGSTITQQLVKNLLTGDDATYERKIREILLASRLEHTLSKSEILALYLNSIYLGRSSWGIEMASQHYFGKSAQELTLAEGAMLAGLTRGPNNFGPDRHPERAREREIYVLTRMQEDGVISPSDMQQALEQSPQLIAYDASRRDPDFPDTGFYAADHIAREAKSEAGIDVHSQNYTVHTTVQTELLRATESALQDGLARYEAEMGRAQFQGAEANISDAVQRLETQLQSASPASTRIPAWQEALELARLPLYDVHWDTALVLPRAAGKSFERGTGLRVGLRDGRTLPLAARADRAQLEPYDVVFIRIRDDKGYKTAKAELRVRPVVQGAALVLENKTGRILAMTGGFSHAASQLNRATQTRRQPGSTFKPISYLAALEAGLQPNTLVRDSPITFAPIVNSMKRREEDYWSPKNYDRGRSGVLTLRRALENSRNRVTAHLLDGAISRNPEESLDRVCKIAQDAQLYQVCQRYYPFVLGAQPVRMIDLAAFFAAIANEGMRPTPYAFDSIEKDGEIIHRHEPRLAPVGDASPATFYQLKTILQGVVERGTARSIQELAPFVAGKTGTTEDENDAWFVGFTNDVTIAVWVGYDNADGQRHTLGSGQTGARVALPIFEAIVEATWAHYAPRTPLNPPSAEAQRELVDMPIDLASGELLRKGRHAFMEHFRRGSDGEIEDTRYQLVPRRESIVRRRHSHPSNSARSIATNPGHWLWNNDRNTVGSRPATSFPGGACIFCPSNSPYP